jgi:sulfite reductase alpha subunit-like flavoprotein
VLLKLLPAKALKFEQSNPIWIFGLHLIHNLKIMSSLLDHNHDRNITVLYGTQTGCARDLAERVGRDAEERRLTASVVSMDEYEVARLPNEMIVIFICSTTGDGDVPDAMLMFWRFLLRRDLSSTSLSNVKCAVFGLGDSAYAQFNVVARKLHARLRQLGASEFHPLVLGDDQSPNGLAGDVDAWLTTLWAQVLTVYPLPDGFKIDTTPTLPILDFRVEVINDAVTSSMLSSSSATMYTEPVAASSSNSSSDCSFHSTSTSIVPQSTTNNRPVLCRVVQNERMTAKDWHQDVRHIILCPTDDATTIEYAPGDIAVIYPTNIFDVDKFARFMGYDPDMIFILSSPSSQTTTSTSTLPLPLPLFPTPCTVRKALKYYINILGVPTRRAVELLSFFCTDPEEKEKLIEIGRRPDGADLYHSYLKREKRSFVELFEDFKSCRPPLVRLFDIVPALQPREFSIASAPNTHGRDIHLAVAVVEFISYYKRQRHGVCTQWLSTLPTHTAAVVPLRIKRGRVNPIPINIPVLLVGPGTGIAPIMSLLHDRAEARKDTGRRSNLDNEERVADNSKHVVGDLVFFGCRHRGKDYLFQEELNHLCDNGNVNGHKTTLQVAFSRDSPPNKVYVQHLIGQNAQQVWSIIDPKQGNGTIVISGSSQRMPQDVMKVIRRIVEQCGGMTEAQASKFLRVMKTRGRCIIECW